MCDMPHRVLRVLRYMLSYSWPRHAPARSIFTSPVRVPITDIGKAVREINRSAEDIQDEDVLAALDDVPREFREVVLLADVQEFSYKEIAEMIGIPVGTVMSRLSRGRKQLRMKLADYASANGVGRKLQEGAYERA